MVQDPSFGKIKALIARDLSKLAEREGLRDAEFGNTELVEDANILPGSRAQRAAMYEALVQKHIGNIDSSKAREALRVKLNLHEGYSDPRNLVRMSQLGRDWGYAVSVDGKKITSRTPENYWRKGRDYLATLISEEIVQRNRDHAWDDLLGDELRRPDSVNSSPVVRRDNPTHSVVSPASGTPSKPTNASVLSSVQAQIDHAFRPPRVEVATVPLSPAILTALETARRACEAANRQFVTIDVLLALLGLPDSKVAQAFDLVEPGLAQDERHYLTACQERAARDGRHPYRQVNVETRDEVWLAREMAWRAGGVGEVSELYVLLGILENPRSGTRRDLEQRLGVVGYASLRQAAERLLETDDTSLGAHDADEL